ncbi:glycoside hydrolase family 76 protein [Granulicella aggregans]|uniref:glycoside hydrolase family 76 protein n=1 Tax=Granulicella aggregans TaxID=474949 RepID=UPI0021DF843F|nr:glycoside hydrolase family 76 protein [Granulicella aggregans]
MGQLTCRAGAFLLVAASLLGCASHTVKNSVPTATDVDNPDLRRASDAMAALQRWYVPATGLYQTTGWWNSANATTTLADYARVSGKRVDYEGTLANTFAVAQKEAPGFLNKFYDDEGWWALAWVDAYDLTGDPRYLTMAESIFKDMAGGWDDTCGGGIWWSKDRGYKNAIANELFLAVAAHLANRTRGAERHAYATWSKRELKWFRGTGLINAQGLINDGLGKAKDQTSGGGCSNNGQTTWTYNQGVILGGLAEMSKGGHGAAELKLAREIARAAMAHLADKDGVLHDPCEPKCGGDGVQFKGIFVRNLAALYRVDPEAEFAAFVQGNAEAIWTKDRGPEDRLGETWSGPYMAANAGAQSSGLDALVGAVEVSHRQGRSALN